MIQRIYFILFMFLFGCANGPIDLYVSDYNKECHIQGVIDAVTFYETEFDRHMYSIHVLPGEHTIFQSQFPHWNSISIVPGEIDKNRNGLRPLARTFAFPVPGPSIIARIVMNTKMDCLADDKENARLLAHELLHTFGFLDRSEDEWRNYLIYTYSFSDAWKLTDRQIRKIKRVTRR